MTKSVKALLGSSFLVVGIASPAFAVDVWVGKKIDEIAAHREAIISQCDSIFGAGFTAGFLNNIQTQAVRDAILTLVIQRPAVVAEKNIQKSAGLAKDEAAKVELQISCTLAKGITLMARIKPETKYQDIRNQPAPPRAPGPKAGGFSGNLLALSSFTPGSHNHA
jgi:hypothetical protein